MLETVKRDWKGVLFQSLAFAVTLLALLALLSFALGGPQREAEAVKYQKAIACVLAVPVTDEGRNLNEVANCFTSAGVPAPEFTQESP